jgi:Arc/MetJ-type ribon-helix-helix transcriptional regulator
MVLMTINLPDDVARYVDKIRNDFKFKSRADVFIFLLRLYDENKKEIPTDELRKELANKILLMHGFEDTSNQKSEDTKIEEKKVDYNAESKPNDWEGTKNE